MSSDLIYRGSGWPLGILGIMRINKIHKGQGCAVFVENLLPIVRLRKQYGCLGGKLRLVLMFRSIGVEPFRHHGHHLVKPMFSVNQAPARRPA